MNFPEIIDQATALLQRKGRMSYRALKADPIAAFQRKAKPYFEHALQIAI